MKYAIVGGERHEAEPGASGVCSVCASAMVAKCGMLRIWHWAHRSRRTCDRWWEAETPWHRDWKNAFPPAWQEVVQRAPDGEIHIADVKTAAGTALEFQHSPLNRVERQAREAFYGDMVWVVNGMRRSRDKTQFGNALSRRSVDPPIYSLWREESALTRDWAGSPVPVYLDFGPNTSDAEYILWRLLPREDVSGMTFLTPVPKAAFIAGQLAGEASEAARTALVAGAVEELHRRVPSTQPLPGFARHLALKQQRRRRF